MKCIVYCAILGAAFVYGLGPYVVEPIRASAQGRTRREVSSQSHLPGTKRAALKVPSLNGKMWRLWTRLEDFPRGFDQCELALAAKIFEASHTYKLKGMDKYLTFIEKNVTFCMGDGTCL